eukprot:PhM_4_TR6776/c1_g2_i1/m.20275/K10745/RNASEH2C; ribonuclease H2 subunit C
MELHILPCSVDGDYRVSSFSIPDGQQQQPTQTDAAASSSPTLMLRGRRLLSKTHSIPPSFDVHFVTERKGTGSCSWGGADCPPPHHGRVGRLIEWDHDVVPEGAVMGSVETWRDMSSAIHGRSTS